MTTIRITTAVDEDGETTESIEVPSRMEVCHDCDGHGSVLNASMRYHAYSEEEFEEFDEEERAGYFQRGGMYDVTCPTCKGVRVVAVPDLARCNAAQRAAVEAKQEDDAERAREDRADAYTRRMENGGYE